MVGRTSSFPMQATEGKRGESSGVTMPVTGGHPTQNPLALIFKALLFFARGRAH
jgi:hypothetical protein